MYSPGDAVVTTGAVDGPFTASDVALADSVTGDVDEFNDAVVAFAGERHR